jgi:hypothetical protein
MDALLPLPLQAIVWDMDSAIKAKLYYPAMLIALTLPEVCESILLPATTSVKERHYAHFVESYAPQGNASAPLPLLGPSGIECYRLRCGVVHRGNAAGHINLGAHQVLFSIPETGSVRHNFIIDARGKKALVLNLVTFCEAMKVAVFSWHEANKDDPAMASGLGKPLAFRAAGAPPFFDGAPLIASG